MPLPTDGRNDDLGRTPAVQQFDELRLRHVGRHEPAVEDHVHAEQRLRNSQNISDSLRGGAGPEDMEPAVLHRVDDLTGNCQNVLSFVGVAGRLGNLHVRGIVRYA